MRYKNGAKIAVLLPYTQGKNNIKTIVRSPYAPLRTPKAFVYQGFRRLFFICDSNLILFYEKIAPMLLLVRLV